MELYVHLPLVRILNIRQELIIPIIVMEVALLVEKKFVLTVLSKENYVIGQKQLPLRHEEQLPFHIVEIFQDF